MLVKMVRFMLALVRPVNDRFEFPYARSIQASMDY